MYEVAEVLESTPHRTWNRDDGADIHYFKVKLADGTMAEAGKTKPDNPPQVGDRYENKRDKEGYLSTLSKPVTDKPGGSKDFKADPAKLRSENARSALHAAKDLVVAQIITLEQMGDYTGKFYAYIENKAKVDG